MERNIEEYELCAPSRYVVDLSLNEAHTPSRISAQSCQMSYSRKRDHIDLTHDSRYPRQRFCRWG